MAESGKSGEGTSKRISGYGLGAVDTVLSVDEVARQAQRLADEGPKYTELRALAGGAPFLSIEGLVAGYGNMEIQRPPQPLFRRP